MTMTCVFGTEIVMRFGGKFSLHASAIDFVKGEGSSILWFNLVFMVVVLVIIPYILEGFRRGRYNLDGSGEGENCFSSYSSAVLLFEGILVSSFADQTFLHSPHIFYLYFFFYFFNFFF